MPMITVAMKRTLKFGAKIVSSVPPMWPSGGEPHDVAHSQQIAERSAQQNRKPEAPERRAGNPAKLRVVQWEQLLEARP